MFIYMSQYILETQKRQGHKHYGQGPQLYDSTTAITRNTIESQKWNNNHNIYYLVIVALDYIYINGEELPYTIVTFSIIHTPQASLIRRQKTLAEQIISSSSCASGNTVIYTGENAVSHFSRFFVLTLLVSISFLRSNFLFLLTRN